MRITKKFLDAKFDRIKPILESAQGDADHEVVFGQLFGMCYSIGVRDKTNGCIYSSHTISQKMADVDQFFDGILYANRMVGS